VRLDGPIPPRELIDLLLVQLARMVLQFLSVIADREIDSILKSHVSGRSEMDNGI